MMIMEEIGVALERRPSSGGLKCPDQLSFHDANKVTKEWSCDETKIEGKRGNFKFKRFNRSGS